MAKNYFNRYVWLIDTISRRGHISLADLNSQWQRSSLNEDGGPLAERTFHNHREAILDIFGIEIKCDRSLGYYIANSDDLEGGGIRKWLLESLSMNNLLNECSDMRDRILFEKIPSSQKWLPDIVNAMRDGKAVEITYQSFTRSESNTFVVHPWCLKLFRQRWYVLGRSEEYETPRVYALDDRMLNVTQTKKRLKVPAKFNAQEYFSHCFGIIVASDNKPCTIDIKVTAGQVKYIKTLKLHESQTIVEENDGYAIFRFCLVPTLDFKQEILSHGSDYEVLAPQWYRDEIKNDIARMMNNYE